MRTTVLPFPDLHQQNSSASIYTCTSIIIQTKPMTNSVWCIISQVHTFVCFLKTQAHHFIQPHTHTMFACCSLARLFWRWRRQKSSNKRLHDEKSLRKYVHEVKYCMYITTNKVWLPSHKMLTTMMSCVMDAMLMPPCHGPQSVLLHRFGVFNACWVCLHHLKCLFSWQICCLLHSKSFQAAGL